MYALIKMLTEFKTKTAVSPSYNAAPLRPYL